MEKYAPTLLDLAPRDIISRCIFLELRQGHGIDGKWYVHLDLRHLGRDVIEKKLPDITDFVRTYLGIDPVSEPVPVQPTAHYAMGGVPTDNWGRVVTDEKNTVLPGFYAAGECACVSVHGGNRLGTNSLVDILVFGRRAGRDIARYLKEGELAAMPARPEERTQEWIARLREGDNGNGKSESVGALRDELQREMMDKASVFPHRRAPRRRRRAVRELRSATSACASRTAARSSTPTWWKRWS
jgi:succinate dehydrogenase / fumarate reductase flavoprotein subunit